MPTSFTKDPDATLDYRVDWTAWLADGEVIQDSEFIAPAGITIATPAPSHTDTTATVWLAGGTIGHAYTVINRISTSQGRTDDRSILISVQDR